MLRGFADLLGYPGPGLAERVRECRALAGGGAEPLLARFAAFLSGTAPGRVEEIYTGTFDLPPRCPLEVGHHLFGADARRNVFLARLAETFAAAGFDAGGELPDHLGVLLRFVAARADEPVAGDILAECLPRAVSKMVEGLAGSDSAYLAVLEALRIVLGDARATISDRINRAASAPFSVTPSEAAAQDCRPAGVQLSRIDGGHSRPRGPA
jgi:nitrate reductase delta subunit